MAMAPDVLAAIDEPWRLEIGDVVAALATDPVAGLSAAEAAQLQDPLVYLLLAAVVVSLVAWLLEGAHGVPFDVIVIVVIVAANAVLGYVQEARAEEAVAALQRTAAAGATVVRDGYQQRVAAEELVPGDVLLLAEGDAVGADGRLIEANSL